MSPGRLITIEGIEGAGKSSAARWVLEWLQRRAVSAHRTREPGGTELAEQVRRIVLERGSESISATAETLLMFAARAIHLDNLIRPALARGDWVVCDRFTDATRAYQGAGRGVDGAWIEQLAARVHGELVPACTLLLDLPVAMGLARAKSRRAGASDRFEAETSAFFERVRTGYLELARREPHRIRLIDAAASLEDVQPQIGAVLSQLIAAGGAA